MKKIFLKYGPVLAVLLGLAGAAFYVLAKPDAPETIASDYFRPEKDKLDSIMGEIKLFGFAGLPQNQQDSLSVALDLYGAADYAKAKTALENYLAAYPDDLTARFYVGMSHLYLEEYEKAFHVLSPLSELPAFAMRDDARWYGALAATHVDKMQAMGLFSVLEKDTTSKYQTAASMVISTLREHAGEFSFQVDSTTGQLLSGSLIVASRTAWWQAGWVRGLLAFLFPAGAARLMFWRNRVLRLEKEKAMVEREKNQSEALLLNILPAETAKDLKAHGHSDTRLHENVTVLFSDFQGFTKISEQLPPQELVACLDTCFRAFDDIMQKHRVEKIKTVGDCYLCAGGLSEVSGDEAARVVAAAQDMLAFLQMFNLQQAQNSKPLFQARIGIHTGPVVGGVVGTKKYAFDIWGDTVNIAARMEQSGEAGRINISEVTYALVKDLFACEQRGRIEVKGKGGMEMYFLSEK